MLEQTTDDIETKTCSKCGKVQLKSNFCKDKRARDGLLSRCKECDKKRAKEYSANNKDKIKEKGRKYYANNKDKIKEKGRKYYANNKDKINKKCREYKRTNCTNNNAWRITENLRTRMHAAMKGTRKSKKTFELLGLESGSKVEEYLYEKTPDFKNVVEKPVIDHIIPCDKYDLTKIEHQKACFHYTNLQLLSSHDNIIKSNRVPDDFDFELTLKNQLELIAHIEENQYTFQKVLDLQKIEVLYEVRNDVLKNIST